LKLVARAFKKRDSNTKKNCFHLFVFVELTCRPQYKTKANIFKIKSSIKTHKIYSNKRK
jgi:hypothetical protein